MNAVAWCCIGSSQVAVQSMCSENEIYIPAGDEVMSAFHDNIFCDIIGKKMRKRVREKHSRQSWCHTFCFSWRGIGNGLFFHVFIFLLFSLVIWQNERWPRRQLNQICEQQNMHTTFSANSRCSVPQRRTVRAGRWMCLLQVGDTFIKDVFDVLYFPFFIHKPHVQR